MLLAQDAAGLVCIAAMAFMAMAMVIAVAQFLTRFTSQPPAPRMDKRDIREVFEEMDSRRAQREHDGRCNMEERRRCKP